MNEEAVGKKFKKIREAAFSDKQQFSKEAGIAPQVWRQWGTSYPRLDLLEKALKPCGYTLSQFFAELEREERGKELNPVEQLTHDFSIIAARDYDAAEAILKIAERTAKPARSSRKPR